MDNNQSQITQLHTNEMYLPFFGPMHSACFRETAVQPRLSIEISTQLVCTQQPSSRCILLESIFSTLNTESKAHPTPFAKTFATKWLVRGKVLYNILVNWHELKEYFTLTELDSQADCKYKARLLKEMLKDKVNFLLFHFDTPIVHEFERVNVMFQTTRGDPHHLTEELRLFHCSLKARVFDSNRKKLHLEHVT